MRRLYTGTGGLINDVTLTPNGDAYLTDSQRGLLFRVPARLMQQARDHHEGAPPFARLSTNPTPWASTPTASCPPATATCWW